MTERRCGQCQLCCEVMGVPEIQKKPYTRCPSQCEKGCGVYDSRPVACRQFRCGWLDGYGASADRPDRIGVILSQTQPWSDGESCVLFFERWRGQADREPRAARMVEALVRNGVRVIVAFEDDRRLIARADVMDAAQRLPEFSVLKMQMREGGAG